MTKDHKSGKSTADSVEEFGEDPAVGGSDDMSGDAVVDDVGGVGGIEETDTGGFTDAGSDSGGAVDYSEGDDGSAAFERKGTGKGKGKANTNKSKPGKKSSKKVTKSKSKKKASKKKDSKASTLKSQSNPIEDTLDAQSGLAKQGRGSESRFIAGAQVTTTNDPAADPQTGSAAMGHDARRVVVQSPVSTHTETETIVTNNPNLDPAKHVGVVYYKEGEVNPTAPGNPAHKAVATAVRGKTYYKEGEVNPTAPPSS